MLVAFGSYLCTLAQGSSDPLNMSGQRCFWHLGYFLKADFLFYFSVYSAYWSVLVCFMSYSVLVQLGSYQGFFRNFRIIRENKEIINCGIRILRNRLIEQQGKTQRKRKKQCLG